jgi:flagellar hook-associated protein FlgK
MFSESEEAILQRLYVNSNMDGLQKLRRAYAAGIKKNAAEINRMRARIEHLRGALKTASGWCFDMSSGPNADDPTPKEWLERRNQLLEWAGDMEPKV